VADGGDAVARPPHPAGLPHLQHLCLRAWPEFGLQLDCSCLAVLVGCSRQLRQLTLYGMAHLSESTLVALLALGD
jgi:hypothetical protein